MNRSVWLAYENAIQDALADRGVLTDPPVTQEDWMWVAATIADHVCGVLPRELIRAFGEWLEIAQATPREPFDITPK